MLSAIYINAEPIDSLLKVLDNEIAHKSDYVRQKRQRLSNLRAAISTARDDYELFSGNRALFLEYRSFSMDTALFIARECRTIASRIDCDSVEWLGMLMEAEALKGFGLYDRALALLDSLPEKGRRQYRDEMLNRYCSIYYSLSEKAFPPSEAVTATKRLIAYRDSIIAEYPHSNHHRLINEAELYRLSGHPERSLSAIDSISALPGADALDNSSTIDYLRAQSLIMLGDIASAKVCLARSSIQDIRDCIRKYESLPELAKLLNEEGDCGRAYNYIMCSLEDIQHSNARSRLFKITEYLPIISSAYAANSASKTKYKNALIAGFSILSFLLMLSLVLLYRHKTLIDKERTGLAKEKAQLTDLKEQLSQANQRLAESAKVKEEYIGYLFNMCSEYIDSHEREKAGLIRKLKTGKISDIEKTINTWLQGSDHLRPFFEMFDSVFLDIFPDFIDKLNSLLEPGGRLQPHDGELLSPELRIYALVRLGINDSTRIARFLHYSPQTVYNYRFKVRSHAIVPKSEFADRVKEL